MRYISMPLLAAAVDSVLSTVPAYADLGGDCTIGTSDLILLLGNLVWWLMGPTRAGGDPQKGRI